jgi:hypothetical protein
LAVAVVVGFGSLSWKKYLKSRPQGVPPVVKTANPASPRGGGFGSRPQDFADPRTTTLRYVSKWERQQGVQGNTTVGGKR